MLFFKRDNYDGKDPADDMKRAFRFLVHDLGYELIKANIREDFKGKNFLVYRNKKAGKQLEFCGDGDWFHCELRRIINGQPARYSDRDHCTGFESLAILESAYDYDHFQYIVSAVGWQAVLMNTVQLLKRHEYLLINDSWIDMKKIRQLEDEEYEKKFGHPRDRSAATFMDEIKVRAGKLLTGLGYLLVVDSDELSFFEQEGMTRFVTYKKGKTQLKITQADWRDDYLTYRIEVDGKCAFEIDISQYTLIDAEHKMMTALMEAL